MTSTGTISLISSSAPRPQQYVDKQYHRQTYAPPQTTKDCNVHNCDECTFPASLVIINSQNSRRRSRRSLLCHSDHCGKVCHTVALSISTCAIPRGLLFLLTALLCFPFVCDMILLVPPFRFSMVDLQFSQFPNTFVHCLTPSASMTLYTQHGAHQTSRFEFAQSGPLSH